MLTTKLRIFVQLRANCVNKQFSIFKLKPNTLRILESSKNSAQLSVTSIWPSYNFQSHIISNNTISVIYRFAFELALAILPRPLKISSKNQPKKEKITEQKR